MLEGKTLVMSLEFFWKIECNSSLLYLDKFLLNFLFDFVVKEWCYHALAIHHEVLSTYEKEGWFAGFGNGVAVIGIKPNTNW